jgi:hypothetical protein
MLTTDTAEFQAFLQEVQDTYGEKVRKRVEDLLSKRESPLFLPEVVLQQVLKEQRPEIVRSLNSSLGLRFTT